MLSSACLAGLPLPQGVGRKRASRSSAGPHAASSLAGAWVKPSRTIRMRDKRADFVAGCLGGRVVAVGGLGECWGSQAGVGLGPGSETSVEPRRVGVAGPQDSAPRTGTAGPPGLPAGAHEGDTAEEPWEPSCRALQHRPIVPCQHSAAVPAHGGSTWQTGKLIPFGSVPYSVVGSQLPLWQGRVATSWGHTWLLAPLRACVSQRVPGSCCQAAFGASRHISSVSPLSLVTRIWAKQQC